MKREGVGNLLSLIGGLMLGFALGGYMGERVEAEHQRKLAEHARVGRWLIVAGRPQFEYACWEELDKLTEEKP